MTINDGLILMVAGAAVFALVVFADPRAAEWLASVCWSRAQAVKAARHAYAAARRSKLGGSTTVSMPRSLDYSGRESA